MYWTETVEHSTFTDIKTTINGITCNIGSIEKPYNFDTIYMATGINNETLRNGDSFIFKDFEAAKNKVIECWEREMVNR
jgi:hypothetical protein